MSYDVFSVLDPRTAAVARRLHRANERQLLTVVPNMLAGLLPGRRALDTSAEFDDKYLALGRGQAAFCHAQVRALRARTVVEFGTSFGVSTLWLAAAVRDNGGGTVIGTEMVPAKAERAEEHLREAGLAEHVDLRVGDALDTLRHLEGPVDFLLNDGFPEGALDVLRLVAPTMRPGAVVVTDNIFLRKQYADYLAWLHEPANGFVSVRIPFRGGTEVSVRA